MGVRFRYVPPDVDARVVLHAAVPLATRAGADVLLAKAEPLVPEDTGVLKASGKVTQDGSRAVVSFSAVADDGYDYAVVQHERLDFHHEKGQARYLGQPMDTEHDAIREAIVKRLAEALGL